MNTPYLRTTRNTRPSSAAVPFAAKVGRHARRLGFEASAGGSAPSGGGSDYAKKLQDDATFDSVMGRPANPADRCARGVYTAYTAYVSGGASGAPKGADLKACATHFQQLVKDPKGTIFETTGVTAGQDLWGCGDVCGGILGVALGPHVTGLISNALEYVGLKDCRSKGPGIPEWTLSLYQGMLTANADGGVMLDPEAPGQFYTLANATATHLVDSGLENCRNAEWFAEKKNELVQASTALAQASRQRAEGIVATRASEILESQGVDPTILLTEKGIVISNAAFIVAATENRVYTNDAIDEVNFNIAHFSPGTLSPTTGKGEWLSSDVHLSNVEQAELVEKQTKKLLDETYQNPADTSLVSQIFLTPDLIESFGTERIANPLYRGRGHRGRGGFSSSPSGGGGGLLLGGLALAAIAGIVLLRKKKSS